MQRLYRIIAHLTDKGLDYTVVEFDVVSETKDNYIVMDDIGGKKTKRIPKNGLLKPSASGFQLDAMSKTWVKLEDIEEGKQAIKDEIEKVCDSRIAYAKKLEAAFTERKSAIGTVWRTMKRRYDM